MDRQRESAFPARWQATCAAGIVAATLLSSCELESDPNHVRIQASAPTGHTRASDFYVDVENGIVTVRAHDAPLQSVIGSLAEHAGLRVLTRDRLNQRITVELQSLTLTATLQELLRGRSFILVGPRQASDAGQDSGGTLWILSKELQASALREAMKSPDEPSAALADRDWKARLTWVSELGDHVNDEQAAMMLASVAQYDEHPSVRAEALHAIASGRAKVHSSVFEQALTDRDVVVRKAAISALENVGGENSLETLAIALRDRDVSVRATAVDAIGEIGGSAARRLLESALGDESAAVREAATDQLVQTHPSRDDRVR